MLCPYCKTEMRIKSGETVVTGDKSENTPTQVTFVQNLFCQNKQCVKYDTQVAKSDTVLYSEDAIAT